MPSEPWMVIEDDQEEPKEEVKNDERFIGKANQYNRGRGSFYGRGYRGRGKYFRGNYRGRGNGQMRINNPRGVKRGGDQRGPSDSNNH